MKLIIAGSRKMYTSACFLESLIERFRLHIEVEEIVSGGASGVDEGAKNLTQSSMSSYFALKIRGKYKEFPADWDAYGKAAGPIRNRQMAKYSDALLLVWDGKSKGSANMKQEMEKLGKPIYEVILNEYNTKDINNTAGLL